jgi:type IV pilus assembly protein PilN
MIRINLIAGERRVAKSAGRAFGAAQKSTLAGITLLLATAAIIAWRYWALGEHHAQLLRDLETARHEEVRLAEVLQQVAEFDTQRAQLQERVALIDELRRGQTAPVHIVDQISRALPEMTWLTSLKQEGYDVTIEGRSTTLAALSDFVANLEATRYFKRPVEIVETAAIDAGREAAEGAGLIDFTIKGTFQMSGLPAPGGKAGAKGARKPTAPKGANVG